ncbi:MAG: membrane dipeptidase [Candidatus Glassbacteria bacterium]|nr:membrane dipeptidase [Candidatus Glassbacteria bacterium]
MPLAWEINHRNLLLDSHVDIPLDYATGRLDPGIRQERLQVDLAKMREGGLDCVFLVAYSRQGPLTTSGYRAARHQAGTRIEAVHRLCSRMHPGRIGLACSADDVRRLADSGRLAAAIGLENGYPIGTDLSRVRKYYDLGVRYITLCHNGHNQLCDSANPPERLRPTEDELDWEGLQLLAVLHLLENVLAAPPEQLHGGLSELGRQVVAEMNRLGIMVDISHLGPASLRDVLEVSEAPVIASHSCCRALCDRARNLQDEQLAALGRKGACIQVTAVRGFLKLPPEQVLALDGLVRGLGAAGMASRDLLEVYDRDRPAYDALIRGFRTGLKKINRRFPKPDVADLADHIDHAVRLIGIEQVGIGSDFGGGGGVRGFDSAAEAANVTAELLRRGYAEEDIARIWGGNLLRVWREVELAAENLRTRRRT